MHIKEIKYFDHENRENYTKIYGEPDTCPICKHKISPNFIYACIKGNIPFQSLEIVYKCPNRKCDHLFIAYFHERGLNNPFSFNGSSLPLVIENKQFPDSIVEISKHFNDIYNQALRADNNGLNEICGPGYRRALEFLIKDYLISLNPELSDEIKKLWLGKAIDKIDSPKIKICAERAAWLGNDETHYVRIWEEKDIENLKDLIDLVVMWIDSEYKTKKYEKEMTK